MQESWNEGVRGVQVPPLINSDAETIRCVAGPGSGKTFGLVRRVERILHPEGLAVDGHEVLVVAFNRVIARQLREDIGDRLKTFEHTHDPVIRTIHALCVEVIREELRMLLPHEVDAMIYDVLKLFPAVAKKYDNFREAQQALRDHEAGHKEHHELWQGARQWLVRHKAHLVSDVPRLLLARLKGGDFPEQGYGFVIVDEFQDLTAGEQEQMFRLRRPGGQLVALGDPRQSIYTFRGNDRQGLAKLESLVGQGNPVTDVTITECQRCPERIVVAANKLMALSGVESMVPVSDARANIHVVTWKTPEAEAAGMAKAIVENIHAHPEDRHLVMVTRRRFGYWLRDRIFELDPELRLDLGFSEGLLDSWAAREAFLTYCLLVDPDRRLGAPGSGTKPRRQAKTLRRRSGTRMRICGCFHRRTMPLRRMSLSLSERSSAASLEVRAGRRFGIRRNALSTCARSSTGTVRMRRGSSRLSSTRNTGLATTTTKRSWRVRR
jgi:superfamily I DNA/RNA helicase